jgi:hypothetical protein
VVVAPPIPQTHNTFDPTSGANLAKMQLTHPPLTTMLLAQRDITSMRPPAQPDAYIGILHSAEGLTLGEILEQSHRGIAAQGDLEMTGTFPGFQLCGKSADEITGYEMEALMGMGHKERADYLRGRQKVSEKAETNVKAGEPGLKAFYFCDV